MNGKKISRNIKSSLQLFWKKFGGAVIAIVILGFLGFVMFNLNLFFVQNFEVTSFDEDNLRYIDSEEVEDFLVGYIGKRIFDVDNSSIEKELKENYSYIYEVYVTKRVPNTLQIRIVERKPTLKLKSGDQVYLMDIDGFILDDCLKSESHCGDFPVVEASYYSGQIQIGQKPFITEIDEIIEILDSQSEIGVNVSEVIIPALGVISVSFDDSTRAVFSVDDDINEKIGVYTYTRENLMLKNELFKEIDLRFDRPVVRVDKYTY
jgi:hypothetical protein